MNLENLRETFSKMVAKIVGLLGDSKITGRDSSFEEVTSAFNLSQTHPRIKNLSVVKTIYRT